WAKAAESIVSYREIAQSVGHNPPPPIILTNVSCAESRDEAHDRAMQWLGKKWESIDNHYHFSDGHLAAVKGYETYGKMAKTYARLQSEDERIRATEFYVKIQIVGTPEDCIAQIAELQRVTGTDHVVTEFSFGGIPHDDAEKNMRLFASRVLPVLQSDSAFAVPPTPMPEGTASSDLFAAAYRRFVENGWNGLSGDPEYGGQGLPGLIAAATVEMWNSANMSFALCPLLTAGAMEALKAHGSDELKSRFLPKLVSGEWAGTMNLTEPQAGSDLSAVRTRAAPEAEHYRLFGQKIFITWGDHDMAENVVHLVLARLPDAPEGTRGISLFLVPKFLVGADGAPAERNDVECASIEHKLGIHASPTCVMSFGEKEGAIGYLVGRENEGLPHMFTMMNEARQKVGLQGLGIAERAYQAARDYAKERVQGRPAGQRSGDRVTIIHHPDVRRMLLTMKSQVEAMRAFGYVLAADADLAHK